MAFAHLHLHSEYSLLDGACRIKPLMKRLKALNMSACAITDHGNLYGAIAYYKACKENGIHPVIGCEVYVCESMLDKGSTRENFHLILLCENNIGYKNLMYLISKAFLDGYYYRPRIDYNLLKEHSEGLIALSACLSGELPRLLLSGQYEVAKKHALYMQDIFGKGNYFIELMDHGILEEKEIFPQMLKLSTETGIKTVATNDCHYLERKDAAAQEVLMCIQTGKTLDDENRMRMPNDEFYVKSEDEMLERFPSCKDAVERSFEIAMRCKVDFDFDKIHLPEFKIESGETSLQMLKRLCYNGFKDRYPNEETEAKERLEYEISVIESMGYIDYFLIVWDFIRFAMENNIMVGPGRGSAAGSIVAYCLYITQVDPIKYSLLFERFLNPERITMPDIDIDFCYERRQEVIDYVAAKYGQDHVSQIITFGTMAARGVIRDVGRVLGYSYQDVDGIAKMIPMELNMTLEKALSVNPELARLNENDPKIKKLIETSLLLEGMPRHAATHAAGVLITKNPVTDYVPLQRNEGIITTQFPMGDIESLGLLKMDFLGLRTLTVIRDALELINNQGKSIRQEDIPLDDKSVYDMISLGETDGVFQLEGSGMRNFLIQMKPNCFEDIVAAISLYRPGPMDSIPKYIKGKENHGSTEYLTPELAPILDVTYGCMVYQEQVMQIVRELAGYSYGQSDLVRRAMAKKKHDVMAKERQHFIEGCKERNIKEEIANQIFDEMTSFASYAFNKSHAAGYSYLSVQTAWLRKHYPHEFFAAVLSSMMGNMSKITAYIDCCRRVGVKVMPPHVNSSESKFTIDSLNGEKCIRFGLTAIKGLGEKAVEHIVSERKISGKYINIFDFISRLNSDIVNKRALESLISTGCFDGLGGNRHQFLSMYENLLQEQSKLKRKNTPGQLGLFDIQSNSEASYEEKYPDVEELSKRELLNLEKQMTGVYISGHPLDEYTDKLSLMSFNIAKIDEFKEAIDGGLSQDGKHVTLGALISNVSIKSTRKGGMMAFLSLEDLTGEIEGIIFPAVYEKLHDMLIKDKAVVIQGKISAREDEAIKLIVDDLSDLSDFEDKKVAVIETLQQKFVSKERPKTLYELAKESNTKVLITLSENDLELCKKILAFQTGDIPVYFKLDTNPSIFLFNRENWIRNAKEAAEMLKNSIGNDKIKVDIKHE